VKHKLALIAALDRHFAIGRNNQLPWHLPNDLKRFKTLTLGAYVLMGRKTAESIGRKLPGRHNLVLTHSHLAPYPGQVAVHSIEKAQEMARDLPLMVIGGSEVFKLALPLATHMYLTWVNAQITDADAFFPSTHFHEWKKIKNSHHSADKEHAYSIEFVDYERI